MDEKVRVLANQTKPRPRLEIGIKGRRVEKRRSEKDVGFGSIEK